jgi:hypothetical protein
MGQRIDKLPDKIILRAFHNGGHHYRKTNADGDTKNANQSLA